MPCSAPPKSSMAAPSRSGETGARAPGNIGAIWFGDFGDALPMHGRNRRRTLSERPPLSYGSEADSKDNARPAPAVRIGRHSEKFQGEPRQPRSGSPPGPESGRRIDRK